MNAQLVKIDVAAADLSVAIRRIALMVDGGTLLERGLAWVFNLANEVDGERRDLRFWRPELLARAGADTTKHRRFSHYKIEWVIEKILPPHRVNFHAGEVDQLLQIRPRTRIDFGAELAGRLEGGANFYSRDALAAFLERRWLGAFHDRNAGNFSAGDGHRDHLFIKNGHASIPAPLLP